MASDTVYKEALDFVLLWEGGYVNHPNDKGGATNKGVTQATYNQHRNSNKLPIKSVREITNDEVHQIYYQDYWKASHCNELDRILAIAHFDWSVNHGVHGATQTLQMITDVTPDGIFGDKSRRALKEMMFSSSDAMMASQYCYLRERWYRSHGIGSQQVFLKGWINRLNALRDKLHIA